MKQFDHVSKSKLGMLFRCEQQWAFRYPHDLIRPPNGSMSFGSAWHDGAGFDFQQKATTGKNVPAKESIEFAVQSLENRRDGTDWGDERFSDAKDGLVKLQGEYATGLALEVQPVEDGVELETWAELDDGTKVKGFIDVVTGQGSIDLKSGKRSWPDNEGQKKLEPYLYTFDEPGDSIFGFHVGVRTKKPKVQAVQVIVSEAAKKGARSVISAGATRMKELLADPEKALPTGFGGFLCSRRQCGYWQECQKRWGLPIPD